MLVRLQRKSHRLETRLSSLPLRVRTYTIEAPAPEVPEQQPQQPQFAKPKPQQHPLDYSATQAVAGPSEWVSHRLIGVDSRLRRH